MEASYPLLMCYRRLCLEALKKPIKSVHQDSEELRHTKRVNHSRVVTIGDRHNTVKITLPGMWRRVVWYIDTDVSEENAVSIYSSLY
jgi:hypothetical protein